MKKDIEREFFKAFYENGVVDNCVSWMQYTYNLVYSYTSNTKYEFEDIFYARLAHQIISATEHFDDSVLNYIDSSLIDEIESNINECKTEQDKKRYIYTLLAPFKRFSDKYIPIAVIERKKKEINDYKKYITKWRDTSDSDIPEDFGTKAEQIKACKLHLDRCNKDIKETEYISAQLEILSHNNYEANSVENCFVAFCRIIYSYAVRLDALLLSFNIDLFEMQKDCGIYIIKQRNIVALQPYIGSYELTLQYIDSLPNAQSTNKSEYADIISNIPQFRLDIGADKIRKLFFLLKQYEYISNDTDEKIFNYVFGELKPITDFKPIQWIRQDNLCAYFISKLCYFANSRISNYWNIADRVFVNKNGNRVKDWAQKLNRGVNESKTAIIDNIIDQLELLPNK